MSHLVEEVITSQLEAYNNRDIEAWLETYAIDAEHYSTDGKLLARGHDEMKANMIVRFEEPDLHAEVLNRMVCGNMVIDHELITRNFPEGKGVVEMLCIYHVENARIQKGEFKIFNKTLLPCAVS